MPLALYISSTLLASPIILLLSVLVIIFFLFISGYNGSQIFTISSTWSMKFLSSCLFPEYVIFHLFYLNLAYNLLLLSDFYVFQILSVFLICQFWIYLIINYQKKYNGIFGCKIQGIQYQLHLPQCYNYYQALISRHHLIIIFLQIHRFLPSDFFLIKISFDRLILDFYSLFWYKRQVVFTFLLYIFTLLFIYSTYHWWG